MKNLSVRGIKELSYTSFLGLINQWNVPPGAYETINKWVTFSNMDKNSHLLEIATTTGFSLREASILSGCSGVGIDISEDSIKTAKLNKERYQSNSKIEYIVHDAYKYVPKKPFSHVIIGAALRFFDEPEKVIEKCVKDFWESEGYLLSCEFYIVEDIPQPLVEKAYEVFGIHITQVPYKDVMSVYEGLELIYEDRKKPIPETEKELQYYCKCTIDRFVREKGIKDEGIYRALFDRLYLIKKTSNDLREFQNYNILVHRYRKDLFPNRYVELF
ncbi:MAG: class I SAM-dependent methyltransferase [Candidatus Dojkabacteria bacterium]|nr:class I SAM-dependent methyltransferase [Candidatus Dojkabacteria bacterium]